jgi:hypothetical protein
MTDVGSQSDRDKIFKGLILGDGVAYDDPSMYIYRFDVPGKGVFSKFHWWYCIDDLRVDLFFCFDLVQKLGFDEIFDLQLKKKNTLYTCVYKFHLKKLCFSVMLHRYYY